MKEQFVCDIQVALFVYPGFYDCATNNYVYLCRRNGKE